MINILVVEDNEVQCRNLTNIISRSINDIKVYSMCVTGEDAINIVNLNLVDIIILDLNLPDISGIDILKHISNNSLEKYINSIIIISGDTFLLSKVNECQRNYINSVMHKPIDYDVLVNKIQALIQEKDLTKNMEIIKEQINNELQKLRFNFSYNGTRYLAEVIFELYINQDKYLDNLKHDIFPVIARRHHKTANTIEGNIKQSINAMFFDCDEKVIIKYFHYNYIVKPKLKEISFTILSKIS